MSWATRTPDIEFRQEVPNHRELFNILKSSLMVDLEIILSVVYSDKGQG